MSCFPWPSSEKWGGCPRPQPTPSSASGFYMPDLGVRRGRGRPPHFKPILLLALAMLSTLLAAQEPTLRVPVRLVVAPTSVTDRAGNFINGLTASDFQLYDNDVPQQVHEDGDFLPISLGIAIQTDLKAQAIARVRELGPLLGALVVGVGGEAAIFTFKEQLQVRQDFTPDLGRLTHALRRMEFSPGPNHVIDAALDAMRLLDLRPEGRRHILLLISDPRDLGSQSTLDDALSAGAASNTLIYWLNVARGAAAEDPVPVLTRYTGGRQYALQSRHALEDAITRIGEEIHGQYLLSYTPANTAGTGFHHIRVLATRTGVEVRSRPGYWPSQ